MARNRIGVTVSQEMRVALAILARRSGLTISSQAMVSLRQALDRTITSEECRQVLIASAGTRTASEWRSDRKAAVTLAAANGAARVQL